MSVVSKVKARARLALAGVFAAAPRHAGPGPGISGAAGLVRCRSVVSDRSAGTAVAVTVGK